MTELARITPDAQKAVLDVLNDEPLPQGYTGPDHESVDFGVVRGLTPDLPIETTLKESVNAVVEVVRVEEIDNPLYEQQIREGKEPLKTAYVFTWREQPDGLFHRAISGNVPNMRCGALMAKMLMRFATVEAKIVAFDTKAAEGYTFAGKNADSAFGR